MKMPYLVSSQLLTSMSNKTEPTTNVYGHVILFRLFFSACGIFRVHLRFVIQWILLFQDADLTVKSVVFVGFWVRCVWVMVTRGIVAGAMRFVPSFVVFKTYLSQCFLLSKSLLF